MYFFGYGHRYIEAVRDFYRLTGPTPLLPRFAMGNWWSRYYRYTQDGYLALMDRFKREGIPFTTSVIDMDWHRVDDVDPKYGSGWTGYSWNRELFPDPPAFLADLHRRGLRTTLNVHPRDGVRAFEDAYPEVAKRVGIDPATEENVEFDLTNPDFVDAYFDMHHRMEAEGVDFWWLDWQQGGVTRQKGLDPLWMLNHMHYLDSGRGGNWPLTFSRYAGPGSHRYPVGFSGDTIVTQNRSPSSRSSPPPLPTSGMAGGATTSAATCSATATKSWRPAGTSSARSARSTDCIRPTRRSPARSRGTSTVT